MMIPELVAKNRTCRKFHQDHEVSMAVLKDLVNLARLSGSAANLQPLKYILSNHPQKNAEIFSCLAWAAYLKEWSGPEEGERPAAYIVILGDTTVSKNVHCDHGIACQSMLLGAREIDLAGCMIGAIDREKLKKVLAVDDIYTILLVLAVGKPKEEVVIEEVEPGGSIKYWRDDEGVHHVPKRRLEDIVIASF